MSRRLRHPDAKVEVIRAKAAATTDAVGPTEGWRFSFGWLVTMKRADGSATRHDAATYAEGVELRRSLFRNDPALVVGWVIQKGPPERPERSTWRQRDPDDDLLEESLA